MWYPSLNDAAGLKFTLAKVYPWSSKKAGCPFCLSLTTMAFAREPPWDLACPKLVNGSRQLLLLGTSFTTELHPQVSLCQGCYKAFVICSVSSSLLSKMESFKQHNHINDQAEAWEESIPLSLELPSDSTIKSPLLEPASMNKKFSKAYQLYQPRIADIIGHPSTNQLPSPFSCTQHLSTFTEWLLWCESDNKGGSGIEHMYAKTKSLPPGANFQWGGLFIQISIPLSCKPVGNGYW